MDRMLSVFVSHYDLFGTKKCALLEQSAKASACIVFISMN